MSKFTLLLLVLLIWLQYSLWFGKNGLQDYNRINNDIIMQQLINLKIKKKNNQLFKEIEDLNFNDKEIEERARNELSMIKSNETFYRLVYNKKLNEVDIQ